MTVIEILPRKPRPPKNLEPWSPPEATREERIAHVVEKRSRPRPGLTRWMLRDGSWVIQRGETKQLTRQCRQCSKWFRATREAAPRKQRWPRYCSEICRDAVARKTTKARKTRGHTLKTHTFDPAHADAYWHAMAILDEPWTASVEAIRGAEEYLAREGIL